MSVGEMYVSLPASVAGLRSLVAEGVVALDHGWTVTAQLRSVDASMGDEDWEYHATQSAAHAAHAEADGRVIVLVARVAPGGLDALDDPEPGRVRVGAPIEREQIEAVFAGGYDAEAEAYDLAWFARQEIETLLR